MLSNGRLCRRLHQIAALRSALFHQLGMVFKDANTDRQYVLASFPVAVCDTIRSSRTKIVQGEAFRGDMPSKKRYFSGVRVYVLATVDGIPVELVFLPGRRHDVKVLKEMPFHLPSYSEIFSDSAVTDYTIEAALSGADGIALRPVRKGNSKRADKPWVNYIKHYSRKQIKTAFSEITELFPQHIQAVISEGFLIKVSFFIYAFTLQKAFLSNYETGFILLKPQRTLRNNPLPPLLRGIKGDAENAEMISYLCVLSASSALSVVMKKLRRR